MSDLHDDDDGRQSGEFGLVSRTVGGLPIVNQACPAALWTCDMA